MKKIHPNSLKGKISFAYGAVFFFLIILLSVVYYFTAYHTFLETHIGTTRQLVKIISNQVDEKIQSANALEKRVLESDDIMEYIFEKAKLGNVAYDWQFRKDLYAITGYNYDFYHMNIVNLSDSSILTFGEEYYYKPYTITSGMQTDLIDPVIRLDGAKLILPPDNGCLYEPLEDTPVTSICRSFSRYPLSQKTALIEIQLSEQSFEKIITDILYQFENGGEHIIIFDDDNRPIYPSDISQKSLDYYTSLNTQNKTMFRTSRFGAPEMIISHLSAETGFTTMAITPETYFVHNRMFYMLICLFFFAVTFMMLILITRRLANRITAPITALKNRISALELEEIAKENYDYVQDESFNELEILNESYARMQKRLKKSLDDVINSKTLTIHSQMMALQAQMDSHFLYNTLTIISIIAEDNDDEQAAAMCVKLTRMLRYITVDISSDTTFAQELEHTQNYTDLISTRFGESVNFLYNTAPALSTIRVPRLIIQPLVENCVKYSRKPGQILEIVIHTWTDEHFWYVNIQDNGDGFSKESLQAFEEKTADLDLSNINPVLGGSKMGLVNIFLRLKLYYGTHFIFRLENKDSDSTEHGISILMGGTLYESKS